MAGETSIEGNSTILANWAWRSNQLGEWTTDQYVATASVDKDKTGIHPRLYFKYLKSKLSMLEMRLMKERLDRLVKLAEHYLELGQEALGDEFMKKFLVLSREQVLYACGYRVFITEEHAEKFRYRIRQTLLTTELKNFAHPLPKNVEAKLKECQEKKLFDSYIIFHLDSRAALKTETQKKEEKERDPILFGRLQYSDRYYFIADWEDEWDDLRLADIVKRLELTTDETRLPKTVSEESFKG